MGGDDCDLVCIVLNDSKNLKQVKDALEQRKILNKSRKISTASGEFHVFTTVSQNSTTDTPPELDFLGEIPHRLQPYPHSANNALSIAISGSDSTTGTGTGTAGSTSNIVQCFQTYCMQPQVSVSSDEFAALCKHLPKKWSVYPPMVLFSANTFELPIWQAHSGFFEYLISNMFEKKTKNQSLGPAQVTHLAVNKPIIESDVMRRPFNLVPIYGDFGPEPTPELYENPTEEDFETAFWCSVVQNSITQYWAPRYTMFSRGNIKEKRRVLDTFKISKPTPSDTNNANITERDIVIDMYSGIGYFTFSYLKNGAVLFCWELNKWSIKGLEKGMAANKFKYKTVLASEKLSAAEYERCLSAGVTAFIFNESNEESTRRFAELGIQRLRIRHVNLGLLPSSKPTWGPSCRLIQRYSSCGDSQVHVHENVSVHDFEKFIAETTAYFNQYGESSFLHLEKVKTFAPDIWHVVLDLSHIRNNAIGG